MYVEPVVGVARSLVVMGYSCGKLKRLLRFRHNALLCNFCFAKATCHTLLKSGTGLLTRLVTTCCA